VLPAREFILQRFLDNTETYAETIYEQSTTAGTEDERVQYVETSDQPGRETSPVEPQVKQIRNLDEKQNEFPQFPLVHSQLPGEHSSPTRTRREPGAFNKIYLAKTLQRHENLIIALVFSTDGKSITSCSFDCKIILRDTATGSVAREYKIPSRSFCSAAFSSDNRLLAGGLNSGSITNWTMANCLSSRKLLGHSSYIKSMAF
jgi:WD40 repeat protein